MDAASRGRGSEGRVWGVHGVAGCRRPYPLTLIPLLLCSDSRILQFSLPLLFPLLFTPCPSLLYFPKLFFLPSCILPSYTLPSFLQFPLLLFSFHPPLSPPLLPSLSDSWWSKNKAGAPPAPRANYPFCQHSNPPGQWTRRARLPAFDQSQSSVQNLDQSQLAEIAAAPSRSLGA